MGYHDVNFSNYIKNQEDPVIFDIGSYNAYDTACFKNRSNMKHIIRIQ
jgi:hypothetical protein